VMSRSATTFGGLIVPTLTPLTSNEQLDVPGFERHLEFLLGAGADAIFILGSNGEGAMLRSATRLSVVRAALRIVNGRVPVMSGVLEISTARVIEEIAEMRGLGLSGYVVTAPLYFDNYSAADLVRHFAAVATKADAPVLIYSIARFARWFTFDLIHRLAEIPNIAGLKDSSGDWAGFQALLLQRPNNDFALLQGEQAYYAVSLFAGCDGLVPGYANVYPLLFVKLMTAARESRWADVLGLQRDLNELLKARGTGGVHANKVLARTLGLMDDYVTSPLPRLDDVSLERLIRDSRGLGFDSQVMVAPTDPSLTGGATSVHSEALELVADTITGS
jgi:4-hydroxy-tetrahydrodipicolinate synthase